MISSAVWRSVLHRTWLESGIGLEWWGGHAIEFWDEDLGWRTKCVGCQTQVSDISSISASHHCIALLSFVGIMVKIWRSSNPGHVFHSLSANMLLLRGFVFSKSLSSKIWHYQGLYLMRTSWAPKACCPPQYDHVAQAVRVQTQLRYDNAPSTEIAFAFQSQAAYGELTVVTYSAFKYHATNESRRKIRRA